jgi:hypothetical protein
VENQANTGKNQEVGFPVQSPILLPVILPTVYSSTHIKISQEELELDSINYKSKLSGNSWIYLKNFSGPTYIRQAMPRKVVPKPTSGYMVVYCDQY